MINPKANLVAVTFVITLFLNVVFGTVSVFMPLAYASTESADYTFYYKDSDKNYLKSVFDDGEKQENIGNKMIITAQGDLFGDKGYRFAFDPDVNKQLNDRTGNDSSDNYYAVSKVYCADNKLSLTKPSTSTEGYVEEIDYTLGFHVNDWNDLQNNKTQELYAGVSKVFKISTQEGVADKETYKRGSGDGSMNPTQFSKEEDFGGHGGSPKDHIDPGCWSQLNNGRIGNVKNYYKLSATEKAKVDKIVSDGAGTSPPGSSGGAGGPDDNVNCDTKLSSPLSWIACPLIDMGTKVTDSVFQDLIQPLMTNVPISTDANDGGYKAWQQFRILGNILLIGTLLAIVYAQIKGDG